MKSISTILTAVTAILITLPVAANAQEMKAGRQNMPAVEQLMLGTSVQNKELTGQDSTFSVGEKVFAWMKVTGATGDSLLVTWKHGEKTYSMALSIGGSPWHTWAYKTVSAAGDWTVTVSTQSGQVLKTESFTVK